MPKAQQQDCRGNGQHRRQNAISGNLACYKIDVRAQSKRQKHGCAEQQTARDLIKSGHCVAVIYDAMVSRWCHQENGGDDDKADSGAVNPFQIGRKFREAAGEDDDELKAEDGLRTRQNHARFGETKSIFAAVGVFVSEVDMDESCCFEAKSNGPYQKAKAKMNVSAPNKVLRPTDAKRVPAI